MIEENGGLLALHQDGLIFSPGNRESEGMESEALQICDFGLPQLLKQGFPNQRLGLYSLVTLLFCSGHHHKAFPGGGS